MLGRMSSALVTEIICTAIRRLQVTGLGGIRTGKAVQSRMESVILIMRDYFSAMSNSSGAFHVVGDLGRIGSCMRHDSIQGRLLV